MKTLKELTMEEIKELYKNNEWFEQQIDEMTYQDISDMECEEFKRMGIDAFDYHDNYDRFYLTTPTHYGVKDGYSVAHKLDRDYLTDENAKLYDRLNELADKWENMTYDEQQDHDEIESEMDDVCDELADSITRQFDGYHTMETFNETRDNLLEMVANGDSWMSDLEIEDGKIKEVLWR